MLEAPAMGFITIATCVRDGVELDPRKSMVFGVFAKQNANVKDVVDDTAANQVPV